MDCSKKCISIVTLIIAVIIFIQTNFLTLMLFNLQSNGINFSQEESKNQCTEENVETEDSVTEEWKLDIPKINVSAIIKEGTTEEIIDTNIGHFTETPVEKGNIGLIAASAGYKENYFSRLNELVEGDEIIYVKGELKKQYKVITNEVINQSDWSYLSNTVDNRITLITGILEEPEKRRCVQAIEIL